MQIDLENRRVSLAVGEFADFLPGPRDSQGGPQGLWRAQLGTHWHNEFRRHALAENASARFELSLSGQLLHRGWLFTLNGRIDQLLPSEAVLQLRELKTVLRTLPADEHDLRAEHGPYFVQLACYRRLLQSDSQALAAGDAQAGLPSSTRIEAHLVFIEADTGLSQTLRLGPEDEGLLDAQLERVVAFLEQRRLARERLRALAVRPPFAELRPGQREAIDALNQALGDGGSALLFEAPTGFGKTGVLLDAALRHMKEGHFDRLVYLTSKSTGQLQVVRTLRSMSPEGEGRHEPLGTWLTRPKTEHCIAEQFHCSRDVCGFLQDLQRKWSRAGLARHYLELNAPRDIESLRRSGLEAGVCPYEITRAALPFCDVWIGDFNYVFAPSSSSLFLGQPGYLAARTLLIVDEAHNLPSRVADAYSHRLGHAEALDALDALRAVRAPQPLLMAWDHWTHFLKHLAATQALDLHAEDDARDLVTQVARRLSSHALDYSRLGPTVTEALWRVVALHEDLQAHVGLPRLWWAPRQGQLLVTCLNAASVLGPALREFGGVILSSATFGPIPAYVETLGLDVAPASLEPEKLHRLEPGHEPAALAKGRLGDLTKRDSRKLFKQLTTGTALLRHEQTLESLACRHLPAVAPWRDEAYEVLVDARVDTSFQQRERHLPCTARTLADWLVLAPGAGPLAAFFPSYAYAEAVLEELSRLSPSPRVALQPRNLELSGQAAWMETALRESEVLLLILGSSFAESIDLLGGRVGRAMIAGPALPEVNAVQQARSAEFARKGREHAFRMAYQIPGMQKINQALGRLVRAPGQKARVLLHCRRFSDTAYLELLAPEYRRLRVADNTADLEHWLSGGP